VLAASLASAAVACSGGSGGPPGDPGGSADGSGDVTVEMDGGAQDGPATDGPGPDGGVIDSGSPVDAGATDGAREAGDTSNEAGPEAGDASDAASTADGSSTTDSPSGSDSSSAVDAADATPPDAGSCAPVVEQHPWEGATHVPVCSAVTYVSNPPSSGNHYPIWAAFQTFTTPVPRGFYVHDLEHGAIVITYNCPGGCAAEVAAAQAFIDALPVDPLCGGAAPPNRRVVMTPDPMLDVRWAASAWLWTLTAPCFDPVAFGQFVSAHYGNGPEVECANGVDPTGMCP
jgi:hypothetical protein